MKALLTGDLHLTDQPRDEYRWLVFEQLRKIVHDRKVRFAFILGDITDRKDKHSAKLVDRLVIEMRRLSAEVDRLYVLKGNHDYVDPTCPFFGFLDRIDNIEFIVDPVSRSVGTTHDCVDVMLLPHTAAPKNDWKSIRKRIKNADLILAHQPVAGASSGGHTIDAPLLPSYFDACSGRTYSGDIHHPQTLRKLTYVGAPYPVHFGDDYKPRCIVWDSGGVVTSVPLPSIQKASVVLDSVDDLEGLSFGVGDQLRITLNLPKADLSRWQEFKRAIHQHADKMGWEVYGVRLQEESEDGIAPIVESHLSEIRTDGELLDKFCEVQSVDVDDRALGQELLSCS